MAHRQERGAPAAHDFGVLSGVPNKTGLACALWQGRAANRGLLGATGALFTVICTGAVSSTGRLRWQLDLATLVGLTRTPPDACARDARHPWSNTCRRIPARMYTQPLLFGHIAYAVYTDVPTGFPSG